MHFVDIGDDGVYKVLYSRIDGEASPGYDLPVTVAAAKTALPWARTRHHGGARPAVS
jgi:hypothetical protein